MRTTCAPQRRHISTTPHAHAPTHRGVRGSCVRGPHTQNTPTDPPSRAPPTPACRHERRRPSKRCARARVRANGRDPRRDDRARCHRACHPVSAHGVACTFSDRFGPPTRRSADDGAGTPLLVAAVRRGQYRCDDSRRVGSRREGRGGRGRRRVAVGRGHRAVPGGRPRLRRGVGAVASRLGGRRAPRLADRRRRGRQGEPVAATHRRVGVEAARPVGTVRSRPAVGGRPCS